MPMPSFLSSIADKAQNAIQASPLAGHLPGGHGPRPNSPDAAPQPSANQAAGQGGQRSHVLEGLSHQFRTLQQQYSSATTPAQKIITTSKGMALDLDSTARDVKAQSKELYTWGQQEPEDLKDVTDRLAYLNFVHGSLASTLSQKLEASRTPWKALRDAEANVLPRRNAKALLEKELVKVENDPKKGGDIREQLRKAEAENAQAEKEIELLKRKAVKESEQIKWDAIREYAEKLVLLSQASTPIIAALPALPPDVSTPYKGTSATAAARASLQRALDNYKTGHINLAPAGADLSRSDTRSFGESHAEELSTMGTYSPSHPHHSPTPAMPIPQPVQQPTPYGVQLQQPVPHPVPAPAFPSPQSGLSSPPINPHALNQAPAPLPTAATTPPAPSVPVANSPDPVPIITPTVAETGIPVAAGSPGPAKGSLHDLKNSPSSPIHNPNQTLPLPSSFPTPPASSSIAGGIPPRHETAEEEKKRLEREERERILHSQPQHESAEDEKKRLEREERERILRANTIRKDNNGGDEELPPYQEPQ